MEIFYNPQKKENLSLALGFFDGIHCGHKKVIESAVRVAKKNSWETAVVSFLEHPTCFLLNRNPEYIISLEDKIKKIEDLGIDFLYLLDFDENLAKMDKNKYFDFLVKMTAPKSITTGFNHYFAKDKQGDTSFLSEICKLNNIIYQKIEPVKINDTIVSSSAIRHVIQNGELELAQNMLGYSFFVKGDVISGQQLASKLGFKTINVKYPQKIIKIPYGVYCAKVEVKHKIYNAVVNWGIKPTISNENNPIIEAHLLEFDENIYGENVKISFLTKIRNEKKFDTPTDLQKQIVKDVEFCKNYLSN